MDTRASNLRAYRELADWYEHHGEPPKRDLFLVLAADAALADAQPGEAERLRQRLLQGNPHHLLKPYASFSQASLAADVQVYIHDLRQNYPPREAEELLRNLREREQQLPDEELTLGPPAPLGIGSTMPLGTNFELPLKVYPLREEPQEPLRPVPPPPPRRPPTRSEPAAERSPIPATLATPLARPASRKPSSPSRPVSPPRQPPTGPHDVHYESLPEPAEAEVAGGAWLTFLLFGAVFTAGIVLAVYTLARPFLPANLLP